MSSIPVRPQSYQIGRATKAEAVQIPLSVRITKRALDLLLSGIGLIILGLLSPFIALAIRLDSKGPILYRQRRAGALKGRTATGQPRFARFDMLKFRTMRTDAEKSTGVVLAEENDPRVTRVGRFLRKTRLDELPQLWNVVRGDMSFVGPRPERPFFVAELAQDIPFYQQRHAVKPGLTGWAQVKYRYGSSREDAMEKLRYDLYYIKHLSVFFDLTIVFDTVKVVLFGKGAA
jgi:exopolysaccharide biosynthesis polyprenyl glycosylphosphotransferase